jgi:hypothetical protein
LTCTATSAKNHTSGTWGAAGVKLAQRYGTVRTARLLA